MAGISDMHPQLWMTDTVAEKKPAPGSSQQEGGYADAYARANGIFKDRRRFGAQTKSGVQKRFEKRFEKR